MLAKEGKNIEMEFIKSNNKSTFKIRRGLSAGIIQSSAGCASAALPDECVARTLHKGCSTQMFF